MQLDFDTGKLHEVARAVRPNRKREYRLLAIVLVLSCVPYAIAFAWRPLATLIVMLFLGYFQVLIAFATSTATDTAHAIRFLLAGSNPIGMTGSSSLLFGAVDSIVDWREDIGERKRSPARFWLLCIYKVAMTPIGCLLMLCEYAWDCVLMLRPGLVRHKWNELFSLAEYHDLISPEKSNDIFYADLAYSRFREDPVFYQWNRLRSMVFELEHYRLDAVNGVGVPETNLFLQSEAAAYQTLKRLQFESIEAAVATHYDEHEDWFPFPKNIAERLIHNARPIAQYSRMRETLLQRQNHECEFDRDLKELLGESKAGKYRTWLLFRWLDSEETASDYLDSAAFEDLVSAGVLRESDSGTELTEEFRSAFASLLCLHCRVGSPAEISQLRLSKIPEFLLFEGQCYVPIAYHVR